jgi:nitrate reductase (cytochrome), electron transfer subunit
MNGLRRHAPWLLLLVAVPALLAGKPNKTEESGDEVEDGLDVWFRDAGLEVAAQQATAEYIEAEAGESELLERAYPGAPPQIPHSVEDMLPILVDENECLECHHPDNTTSKKDKPLPESHFERPTMGAGREGGQVWVITSYAQDDDVVGFRYNCVQCHTPQATNAPTPASTFENIDKK